jgi:Na+/melibiose symporter-like transporter
VNKQRGYAVAIFLTGVVCVAASVIGWIANIAKLLDAGFDPITGESVVRIIGVFVFPIGIVMGYL